MSTTNPSKPKLASLLLLLVALCVEPALAQDSYAQRRLIGMQSESPDFRRIVDSIRDPGSSMVPDSELRHSGIYFRLTERRFVVDGTDLDDQAHLGGSPYVFITVPQAAFGRSLYGIYSDLGYDAEGILRQRGKNMAALVFRYKPDVQFSSQLDGDGPLQQPDFKSYVYVPTWQNGFQLLARLAGETVPTDAGDALLYLDFDNEADRTMARFYPAERRMHVAQLPYLLLRMAGGPDWDYRRLLESKMSMNSHFRGVGRTENTLSPADDRKGLPEFVGPNRKLSDLQDYAVIDMGRMEFTEVHD